MANCNAPAAQRHEVKVYQRTDKGLKPACWHRLQVLKE
jgi:hypothetical protein